MSMFILYVPSGGSATATVPPFAGTSGNASSSFTGHLPRSRLSRPATPMEHRQGAKRDRRIVREMAVRRDLRCGAPVARWPRNAPLPGEVGTWHDKHRALGGSGAVTPFVRTHPAV